MKILIIGSRGFIGSHLAGTMGRLGEVEPVSLSSLLDGAAGLRDRRERISTLFKRVQPDVCVNCSGAAHVPSSIADPLNDFEKNTLVVYEMLAAMRSHSPHTRFVHLSSAAVYGNPVMLPITETAPLDPVSPYGYHKLAAEQFCREFAMIYGLRAVSLRIFSAYGPGLRKQLLWDTFCKWRDAPTINLFGTGEETRDFLFIDDVCDAIHAVVEKADFSGESINVASGEAISIRDIVALLLQELGGEKRFTFEGRKREGDPNCWRADVTRLKSLGFQQKTAITDGIKATARWLKEQGS